MSTQKCILVKRGRKGQCVCAKRISKSEAEALGIDWSKIPSFAELCRKAGIEKIVVGSTHTTASKILAKYKNIQHLGGFGMPVKEYKYPLIEGVDDIEGTELYEPLSDIEDIEDFSDGTLGQLKEISQKVLPNFKELQALLKGVGGIAGAYLFNKYAVNKLVDRWWLQSLIKAIAGFAGGKVLVQKVDPSVGVGFSLYSLWDAIITAKEGYRLSQAIKKAQEGEGEGEQSELPPPQGQEGQQQGVGQIVLSRPEREYLFGTELYEESVDGRVIALTPEEEELYY